MHNQCLQVQLTPAVLPAKILLQYDQKVRSLLFFHPSKPTMTSFLVWKIARLWLRSKGCRFLTAVISYSFMRSFPSFLEVATSLYIFVFKLNEELGACPMTKYHLDGKAICKLYQCSETYEQVLEHCLCVVCSQEATDEKSKPPQIMITGTHKDKKHESTTETREMKNK